MESLLLGKLLDSSMDDMGLTIKEIVFYHFELRGMSFKKGGEYTLNRLTMNSMTLWAKLGASFL